MQQDQQRAEELWFSAGERLAYDCQKREVAENDSATKVFVRHEGDLTKNLVTFLPGYPDGSFGWSKVLPHLPEAKSMPKLFVEYLGMGDSDKPKNYTYSIAERADLVEALWRRFGVRSTVVVAFDFSSLVVLEHLQRRLERGEAAGGPQIQGVIMFNGGLFIDGHSHPWYTTPILQRVPDTVSQNMRNSYGFFKRIMTKVMWSREYGVTDAEVRSLYNTMDRHDGLFYLTKGAGFVTEHKAQGNRLDFDHLFRAYHQQIPFLVGGSTKDLFEHRQVDLTQKRLGGQPNLTIERLPGGHLTTNEQPRALADLIREFYGKSSAGTI